MSSAKKRPSILQAVLTVLFLTWPAVHMVVSARGNLSSWNLAGWGMYATTHPRRTPITLLWLDSRSLPTASLGDLLDGVRVTTLVDDEVVEIDYDQHTEEQIDELLRLARELQSLRWEGQFQRFVRYVGDIMERPRPYRALVLFSELRVSLRARRGYTRTKAYFYDAGSLTPLGSYSSLETSEAEIIAGITARLLDVGANRPEDAR